MHVIITNKVELKTFKNGQNLCMRFDVLGTPPLNYMIGKGP